MNANELLTLIAQGENQALEFKQTWPRPEQLAREIVAFANSNENSLVISELMRLYQLAGVFHFDAVAVHGTTANDLNQAAIDDYFAKYDIEFSKETQRERDSILRSADMTTPTGECTVAGLLCFGINPSRYLPQSGISFAHFSGIELSDTLLDRQEINGTLAYQIDTALATLKNHHITPSTIQGAHRVDSKPQPSDKALRELLVNACVHRNYSIAGSKIRLFLFDDRIECHSPGRLPNTITLDKLRFGVSYASNPIIIKFMDNLRYIDRLGRGFPLLYREAKRLGSELEVDEIGDVLRIVLRLSR
jgi:ATP-dependent DNA helicase RecG